jgi:hypothetical protein
VIFGVWDIGYYAWLWVFSGWPPSVGTWDLLFLIPAPWAGPVWEPIVVSAALIGFGLACAGRLRAGGSVRFGRRHLGALLAGGAIVIVSFLLNAGPVLEGGTPTDYSILASVIGIGSTATIGPRLERSSLVPLRPHLVQLPRPRDAAQLAPPGVS